MTLIYAQQNKNNIVLVYPIPTNTKKSNVSFANEISYTKFSKRTADLRKMNRTNIEHIAWPDCDSPIMHHCQSIHQLRGIQRHPWRRKLHTEILGEGGQK